MWRPQGAQVAAPVLHLQKQQNVVPEAVSEGELLEACLIKDVFPEFDASGASWVSGAGGMCCRDGNGFLGQCFLRRHGQGQPQ